MDDVLRASRTTVDGVDNSALIVRSRDGEISFELNHNFGSTHREGDQLVISFIGSNLKHKEWESAQTVDSDIVFELLLQISLGLISREDAKRIGVFLLSSSIYSQSPLDILTFHDLLSECIAVESGDGVKVADIVMWHILTGCDFISFAVGKTTSWLMYKQNWAFIHKSVEGKASENLARVESNVLKVNKSAALKLLGSCLASMVPKASLAGVGGTVNGLAQYWWDASRKSEERWANLPIKQLCFGRERGLAEFSMHWNTPREPVWSY